MRSKLALLSCLFLAQVVCAQTMRVSPHYCTEFEGIGADRSLAGHEDLRMQVLYLGSQVATRPGLITALAFRRDGEDSQAYKAWTVSRRILLDHSKTSPNALSGTFAGNLSPAAQEVFRSTALLFPAVPEPVSTPAPFSVLIPFKQPFLFDPGQGNLLVDLMGEVSNRQGEWRVDSHAQSYGLTGLTGVLGSGCVGTGGQRLELALDAYQLHVGGSFSLTFNHTVSRPSVLLAWIGLSWSGWGGVPLPFDLAFLGAPGCSLQVSMDLVATLQVSGNTFPPLVVGLRDPVLAYNQIGIQALAVAPGANAADLVFAEGLKAMIWPGSRPTTVLNCMIALDSTATMGSISRTPFGPVTRFQGNLP